MVKFPILEKKVNIEDGINLIKSKAKILSKLKKDIDKKVSVI